MREATELSPQSYLDFCIMLGTDASPRIKDIGPTRAFKLINQHGSIETLLEANPKIRQKTVAGYMDMVASARQVFQDLPPLPDALDLEQGVWDDEVVERWLEEEQGVRLETINGQQETGWMGEAWGSIERSRSFSRIKTLQDEEEVDELNGLQDVDGEDGVEPDWQELVREVMEEAEGGELEDTKTSEVVEIFHGDDIHDVSSSVEDEIWEEVVREEMKRP